MRSIIYTALILASGCSFTIPDARFGCDDDSDCPSAHWCEANRCKAGLAPPVDGGIDGGDDGGDDAEVVEATCVMEMTALALPESSEVVGFDLDGIDNSPDAIPPGPTPAEGCNVTDLEGGIDNTLGPLLHVLKALGAIDFQDAIDVAIESDALSIVATVHNYVGPGSVGVTLTLVVNGEAHPERTEVLAEVDESGDILANLSTLTLTIPEVDAEGTQFDVVLAMTDVIVRVAAPTAPATSMVVGGRVLYGDETSGPQALRQQIVAIVVALDTGLEIEEFEPILNSLIDLSSDGVSCDSLSIGLRATLQKTDCD